MIMVISGGYRDRGEQDVCVYNAQASESTGLKHGDIVWYLIYGFDGYPRSVCGKVIYNKRGRLVARFDGIGDRALNKDIKKQV